MADVNVENLVSQVIEKVGSDPSLIAGFFNNPIPMIESIIGVDVPDDVVRSVIDTLKGKIGTTGTGTNGSALGALSGLTGLSGAAEDKGLGLDDIAGIAGNLFGK
ncbi:MAG: hypothetical protein HGA54_08270 [Actinobacteria bacterium]|nr:hypothetical protein [Actinomycetota bacterium]